MLLDPLAVAVVMVLADHILLAVLHFDLLVLSGIDKYAALDVFGRVAGSVEKIAVQPVVARVHRRINDRPYRLADNPNPGFGAVFWQRRRIRLVKVAVAIAVERKHLLPTRLARNRIAVLQQSGANLRPHHDI